MAGDLLELLRRPGPILLDGAMGTRLMELGLPPGMPPELLNEEAPDAVLEVHRSYIAAGSQVILTNSFGANRRKLARLGLGDRAAGLATRAAELARGAGGRVVLGSIGPVGELLRPLGKLTLEEAQEAYVEQAVALARGGVDGLLLETFFDLEELKAALRGVVAATGLPVLCSMSFGAKGKTMMGVSVERFVREIEGLGEERVVAVGANCGAGPKEMEAIAEGLCAAAGRLPVLVKPNAGRPELVDGRTVYQTPPGEFARSAGKWLRAGVKLVGGCCGTTAEHIRALAELIERWTKGT
ncbi:MAG: Homocysteine S-methyltransferase [Acetothermia bacterium 64_32]|nr:MAG: Homocysteine S-methyltransferase [Acetothermia bacterium 64_32]HAF70798.1 homocysteine methyltransferase [Candidatus Acetothermia bacterium]